MCGIAGVIHCGNPDVLDRMNAAQSHRGPDDHGKQWFARTGSGLGHRRLSIIDLSPGGHQPMADDEGRFWVVFNGEIYNFAEVRSELVARGHTFRSESDTEVLVKAFREWGAECLSRLNGMFAFAIYDTERDELFAARDRLGIKPFYYHHDHARLVFASEVKALLATSLVPRAPDLEALRTPARYQVSPRTGFEGIRKLPPGHQLLFRDGRLDVRPYWSVRATETDLREEGEVAEELEALLRDAVRLQMVADVPVGVLLSGGLDSSVVSALMRGLTSEPVHSFTIRFTEEDQRFEKMPPDHVWAAEVARELGFVHHEREIRPDVVDLLPRMVRHLDEPVADPAAINTYLLATMAREQGIVVMLNGVGGDEVYGGYRKHLACLAAETYRQVLPRFVRRALEAGAEATPVATRRQGLRSLRWTKRFLGFASRPPLERFLTSDLALTPELYRALFPAAGAYEDSLYHRAHREVFENAQVSYLTQMCLDDTLFFLPELNLTYSDKAMMAAGVEGRPPLIDHRLVELMFRQPPRRRIRGARQKALLKRVAERHLPRRVVHRPKAPFGSPLRAWMRGPLAPMVDDMLSESALRARGLYHPPTVARLVERDRQGLEDNAHVVWTLLTTEVWFREFFG